VSKLRKVIYAYGSLAMTLVFVVGVSYAAFTDKASILGTTFSVGSSDIKLFEDVSGGIDGANLVNEKAGPSFAGVSPNWVEDYLVKIYNNAATDVLLSSNANYETANDPDDLRQIIYVEPFSWDDVDGDGIVDDDELASATSYGRKTIVKWKTEGFDLGNLASGEVKGFILRLSTDSVSDSKQGSSATYDFEFDSVGL
jgi:hypothetical protein